MPPPAPTSAKSAKIGTRIRFLSAVGEVRACMVPSWGLWLVVLIVMSVNCGWVAASERLYLAPGWLATRAAVLVLIAAFFAYRNARSAVFDPILDRMFKLMCFLALALLVKENVHILNCLLMSLGLPMADGRLQAVDRALGFQWNGYAGWVSSHPWMVAYLGNSYLFSGRVVLLVGTILILRSRFHRLDELCYLCLAGSLVCIGAAAFVPAQAAWTSLGDPQVLAAFGGTPRPDWLLQLAALRADAPLMLDPVRMGGLATFPSFHCCIGIIIAWCSRGHWLASGAGVIYGLSVIAATPVFGNHYLVDMLGGGVAMLVLILLWHAPWGRWGRGRGHPPAARRAGGSP